MDKSKVVKEAVEKAERDAPDAGLAGRHPRVVVVTRTGDIVCGLPRMSAPEDVASGDAEFARADFLAAALSRAVDAAYDAGKAEAHARAAREETATLAALADANEWEVRAKAAEERAGRAEAALPHCFACLAPPEPVPPTSKWSCVDCGHEPERHAPDGEELRECFECACQQYRCAT